MIFHEGGAVMAVIARVIGVSLLTGGLGAVLGFVLVGKGRDSILISLILGCVGSLAGALAGAAREIVAAMPQKPSI